MKRILGLLLFISIPLMLLSQKLIEVGIGYSSTSVNTVVFRNSSLTTYKNSQYIAYYDSEGYVVLGKRKLHSSKWNIKRSQYKGNVKDAHNSISIMVDGDGFLHVSFDHHASKLNYCKSLKPGSLLLGPKEPMVGLDEVQVTYPEFYRLKNGDLLFFYRAGVSGNGNLIMNKYDIKTKKWERIQNNLIDGEGKRNAYWQLYVDKLGTIHLSWVWRETGGVETNHDLCYACSFDCGKSWYKSTGEQYSLPISYENAEYACIIPQKSELINQTSMSADDDGNPYIVTYWRDKDSKIPQYRLVWNDGNSWNERLVTNRTIPFSLKGGGTKSIPISRPRVVVGKGRVIMVFKDAERENKVSVAYSDDFPNYHNWNIKDFTDFSVGAWEPSIDTELWRMKNRLNVFVQTTNQGDGERMIPSEPTPVYVLEITDY